MGLMSYIKQAIPRSRRAREIIKLKENDKKLTSQLDRMSTVVLEDFSFATRTYMREDIIKIRQDLTRVRERKKYYEKN